MTVYKLTRKLVFPPPELADDDGLLAIGGDLSVDRLVLAYSMGIFPWYSEKNPILWWSPDPRLILFPAELKVSRSLRQTIKKGLYRVTTNTAFEEVIRSCATITRKGEKGTWITTDMIEAYIRLHRAGYAHSVEAWDGDDLAGGFYGVIMNKAFFGESMFAKKNDASKVAFATYALQLADRGFELIDCQVTTEHMKRFGAREISRAEFMKNLKKALH
ncbi:MAG: leucyl/phenylalanyl-tRNA--protein transferase [Deltaproteobacteria bacterium HGW-Deltaproteobacteria-6]|jgi:leucyl/phenylalanyl-tRNA--protein transferase|nr:MAG: leucyl/phenylalanyl-tRNA--protein transferase [Deltaproteobacteria bacterium HGW-Deltaproteobacteria-6]